jgi:hypothetical protein
MVSRKLKALVLAALVLAATVGVVWYFFQEHGTPSHLIELDSHSLPDLKDAFNRAADSARLIVLLSPPDQLVCGGLPQCRTFSAGIHNSRSRFLPCGSPFSSLTGINLAPAFWPGFQIRAWNRSGTGSTWWRSN